jgi:acyl carrier protein
MLHYSSIVAAFEIPSILSIVRIMMKEHSLTTHVPKVQIEATLRIIAADILNIDESTIHAGSRFREDLGADSLDLVNLIMAFSNAFKAEICDADVLDIQTIGEAAEYLERHLVLPVDQID